MAKLMEQSQKRVKIMIKDIVQLTVKRFDIVKQRRCSEIFKIMSVKNVMMLVEEIELVSTG